MTTSCSPQRRHVAVLGLTTWLVLCLPGTMVPDLTAAERAAPRETRLFLDEPASLSAAARLEPGVVWQRTARLNPLAVPGDAAGVLGTVAGSLLFEVGEPKAHTLRFEGGRAATGGGWLARGEVEGVKGSHVALLSRAGHLVGTVRIPGEGIYVLQGPVDGRATIRKLDPLKIPRCGVTDMGFQEAALRKLRERKLDKPDADAAAEPGKDELEALEDKEAVPGLKPVSKELRPLNDPAAVIDIMVIYTPASRLGAGGKTAMEVLIELAIEEANDCFINSQINARLNLVHVTELPYTESGDIGLDLQNVMLNGDGVLDEVQNLRVIQFKADLVCLVTESEGTGFIAGIAYLLQDYPSGSPELGFSVVLRPYLVGDYVFAHEIGHNLGCAHDRLNSSGQGTFPYSYGHRFSAQGITYATVMTYPPGVRIPNFSNPLVSYNGVATGVADGAPNSADTARTINLTAPNAIASYYTASRSYVFSAPTYTVSEGGGSLKVTVRREGTSTLNMSVKYATTNGTALAGQDYVATSGTLALASGQTEATFTVTILNDSVAEPSETFEVILNEPRPLGSSRLGLNYRATVTIEDDENSFYFAAPGAVISEAQGAVPVPVLRPATSSGTASVTVRPVAGTALAGTDFDPADQVVVFLAGEAQKSVSVPLINDFVAENDKAFSLNLVAPSAGYTLAAPSTMSVTLLDDDRPGAFDAAFNALSGPNDNVFALAVRPDGRVLVGGGFARINGSIPAGIAQFKADGSLDATFNPGIGVAGTVFAVGLQTDGKVVLGGAFTAVNGFTRKNLARLNADGSLDPGFDPGVGPDETVRTLAVLTDNRIVIGGFFTTYQGQSRPYVARVLPGGGLDASFNPGSGPSAPVRTLVVQSDGGVIIGGNFTQVAGVNRSYLARLTGAGGLDPGFVATASQTVRALAMLEGGKVLAGGEFTTMNGNGYSYLARLNANGSTDTTFNLGARPNGFVRAIAVQPDQQILIGGDFTAVWAASLGRIGRLTANGAVDSAFLPGSGANATVYTLAVEPGKYVTVGGEFSEFAGVPRSRLARARIAPNLDTFKPVIVPLARGQITGGPITIQFNSRAGDRYALDGSDNLATWSGIMTNTAASASTQLTDPAPPATRRYYRIRQVP
jgi:uncharacterized delta-60 repeat protein